MIVKFTRIVNYVHMCFSIGVLVLPSLTMLLQVAPEEFERFIAALSSSVATLCTELDANEQDLINPTIEEVSSGSGGNHGGNYGRGGRQGMGMGQSVNRDRDGGSVRSKIAMGSGGPPLDDKGMIQRGVAPPRQSNRNSSSGSGGGQWARGQAAPKPKEDDFDLNGCVIRVGVVGATVYRARPWM